MVAPPRRTRTVLAALAAIAALLAPGSTAVAVGPPVAEPAGFAVSEHIPERLRPLAELAAEHRVTLDEQVLAEIDQRGSSDYWVVLEPRADLRRAREIEDWAARGQYVYDQLVRTARTSQAELLARLDLAGARSESFWVANAVRVPGGERGGLDAALRADGVAEIRADEPIPLPDPVESADPGGPRINTVEWGIADIGANQVWTEFGIHGDGIVVGNIDTGVDYTHPALVDQYRGNLGSGGFDHDYNWWDPSQECPAAEPCDNNRHGTHTMGTMVGDDGAGNQIGVAPAAAWIAAKGCESNSCPFASLLSSGQFMLAPTDLSGADPRPELRPHVVNNSWAGSGGQEFFDDMVAAWVAAGIFPVFANGNAGPGCGTARSPADGPQAWGVGAYGPTGAIARFSSRGPGRGGVRPHIAAPGVEVRSSTPAGGYAVHQGTSMAAPHQSGAIALMWSAAPALIGDIALTRELLAATAVDVDDTSCGGTPDNNNVYGEGRLDAFGAVTASPRSPSGDLAGTVTDLATGDPVERVTVSVEFPSHTRSTRTAADGTYRLRALAPGEHQATLTGWGYAPVTVTFEIAADQTTTLDAALEPLPRHDLTGTVTDAVSGNGIPAVRVEVVDVPVDLAATTDQDGGYRLPDVPAGSYQLQVTPSTGDISPLWLPQVAEVEVTAVAAGSGDVALPLVDPRVERVSVSSTADKSHPGRSLELFGAEISPDGRYVKFWSDAPNLTPDQAGARASLYVHDRVTRETTLVLARRNNRSGICPPWSSPRNCSDVAPVERELVAADHPFRYVAFLSESPGLVDRDYTHQQVFVYDRATGETELVSVSSDGVVPDQDSGDFGGVLSQHVQVTPDGRYVVYPSRAPGLVDVDYSALQVFVHDRVTGTTALASVNGNGAAANGDSGDASPGQGPRITPDGRHVLFQSEATNLVEEGFHPCPDDPSVLCWHVFVHDREIGRTHWVSTHDPDQLPPGHAPGGFQPTMSADGLAVAYIGSTAFTCLFVAELRCPDSYLHQRGSGATLALSSTLPERARVILPIISGDGRFVVFAADTGSLLEPPKPGDPLTGVWVLDRQQGTAERLVEPYDGAGFRATPGPAAVTPDGRFVLIMASETATDGPILPGREGPPQVLLIDRDVDPDAPRARFVPWDLELADGEVLTGVPVQVTARVTNAGDAAGEYAANLHIDGRLEETTTVSLAPGETTEVSWTVTRDRPDTYLASLGHLTADLQVLDRAPVLDLAPEQLDVTVPQGRAHAEVITIRNAGHDRKLEWQLTEDPDQGGSADASVTISQSASLEIMPNNAAPCGLGLATFANQFLRVFPLSDAGLAAGLDVTEVTFGVERVRPRPFLDEKTVPIAVNLYTVEGDLTYDDLTLRGSAVVDLPPQEGTLVTVPVAGGAPAGSRLVVEIAAPFLGGGGSGWFYPGTNDLGETGPSYVAASQCGVEDPVPNTDIGIHGRHLVMTVTGVPTSCQLPEWLVVAPSGGSVGAGAADELAVTVDATGLAPGAHRAQVCLHSNDPATPLFGVPVTVTVAEEACDATITGRHLGRLVVSEGTTCLAEGAHVIGGIRVEPGAGLVADGARVTGPVTATGAELVNLHDTRLIGPVTATATTGSLTISGNRVTGAVRLTDNTTGVTPIVVSANHIAGVLSCDGNQPPPVNLGGPNRVTGPTSGQCADL